MTLVHIYVCVIYNPYAYGVIVTALKLNNCGCPTCVVVAKKAFHANGDKRPLDVDGPERATDVSVEES